MGWQCTVEQLLEHESVVADAAKYGLKVGGEDEGKPPGEVAFPNSVG